MSANKNRFLSFLLGNEYYAISIDGVKEIISMIDITTVPKMPSFILGVINLRGKIIPVIDLRLKFSLDKREYDNKTCIIVMELNENSRAKQIGIVVDTACEVLSLYDNDILPPPEFYENQDLDFIKGIGKSNNNVFWILNLNKILNTEETILIKKIEIEE